MSTKKLRAVIDAAEGRVPADKLFVNAQIVDVYGLRVVPGQVAVKDGLIVGVLFGDREPDRAAGYEAAEVVDCGGRYLAPGHIESSNVRPVEYARMALARGPTTAIADSHEISNVCGLDGLEFMIEDGRRAPISFKFMMPSCVPALPDEQTSPAATSSGSRAESARIQRERVIASSSAVSGTLTYCARACTPASVLPAQVRSMERLRKVSSARRVSPATVR